MPAKMQILHSQSALKRYVLLGLAFYSGYMLISLTSTSLHREAQSLTSFQLKRGTYQPEISFQTKWGPADLFQKAKGWHVRASLQMLEMLEDRTKDIRTCTTVEFLGLVPYIVQPETLS